MTGRALKALVDGVPPHHAPIVIMLKAVPGETPGLAYAGALPPLALLRAVEQLLPALEKAALTAEQSAEHEHDYIVERVTALGRTLRCTICKGSKREPLLPDGG